jgi:probable HAF family extracellular repeat protein
MSMGLTVKVRRDAMRKVHVGLVAMTRAEVPGEVAARNSGLTLVGYLMSKKTTGILAMRRVAISLAIAAALVVQSPVFLAARDDDGVTVGSFVDLTTLGGTMTKAFAINAGGTVVGYGTDTSGSEYPVVWSEGSIAALPRAFTYPGEHRALAINTVGQIVGHSGPAQCGEDAHAVVWQNSIVADLGRCAQFPYFSRANGINAAGVVVGYEGDNYGGPSEAFHTVNGVLTRIGRPAPFPVFHGWSVANAINADGTIAVVSGRPSGYSAYSWSNGSFTELPSDGSSASPVAINDSGVIVGYTLDATGRFSAARWEAGYRIDLGTLPGGTESKALGINNNGQIVGWSTTSGGDTHAVIWANGSIYDLGAPPDAESHLEATGINDYGEICGWYVTATGDTHAFRTYVLVTDPQSPTVACAVTDGVWHAGNVSLACTAGDTGSGLFNAADASFSLMTNIGDGLETTSAQTNSRQVCDVAGNCTTAGPIGGNKIDRRPPTVTLTAPTASTFLLGQAITGSYGCADGGSGIATCTGPVASGSAIDTSTVGSHPFAVSATDAVGHAATSTVTYTVAYNQCVLYDQTKASKAGSTVPIKLALCNAAGANVSSVSVPLVATGVYLISTNAPGPLADSGNANPDNQFRFADGSYIFNLSLKGFAQGTYVDVASSRPGPGISIRLPAAPSGSTSRAGSGGIHALKSEDSTISSASVSSRTSGCAVDRCSAGSRRGWPGSRSSCSRPAAPRARRRRAWR